MPLVRTHKFARTLVLLVALGAASALTACGDAPVVPEGAQVVSVQLTSQDKVLHTVGPDDSKIYGSNHLTGDGTVDGEGAVQVEMLATVNYTDGSGDFGGVITFTFADGSSLGVLMEDGAAVAATDTTEATFHSGLRVIGGTGSLVNAHGSGTFVGTRKEALGGAVEATFTLSYTG
ncbi:MAG: hypothetical protein Q7V57_00385 [Actinomycetota bacterium]|nr:hypothetical protein [Actinomycetota bacterium]